MHADGGEVPAHQRRQQPAEPRIVAQRLHLLLVPADVHDRVVCHDQLRAELRRLVRDGPRHVERDENPRDLAVRVADEQTHVVPALSLIHI